MPKLFIRIVSLSVALALGMEPTQAALPPSPSHIAPAHLASIYPTQALSLVTYISQFSVWGARIHQMARRRVGARSRLGRSEQNARQRGEVSLSPQAIRLIAALTTSSISAVLLLRIAHWPQIRAEVAGTILGFIVFTLLIIPWDRLMQRLFTHEIEQTFFKLSNREKESLSDISVAMNEANVSDQALLMDNVLKNGPELYRVCVQFFLDQAARDLAPVLKVKVIDSLLELEQQSLEEFENRLATASDFETELHILLAQRQLSDAIFLRIKKIRGAHSLIYAAKERAADEYTKRMNQFDVERLRIINDRRSTSAGYHLDDLFVQPETFNEFQDAQEYGSSIGDSVARVLRSDLGSRPKTFTEKTIVIRLFGATKEQRNPAMIKPFYRAFLNSLRYEGVSQEGSVGFELDQDFVQPGQVAHERYILYEIRLDDRADEIEITFRIKENPNYSERGSVALNVQRARGWVGWGTFVASAVTTYPIAGMGAFVFAIFTTIVVVQNLRLLHAPIPAAFPEHSTTDLDRAA